MLSKESEYLHSTRKKITMHERGHNDKKINLLFCGYTKQESFKRDGTVAVVFLLLPIVMPLQHFQ